MSSSVSAIIGVHLKICNVFIVDKLCEFVDNLLLLSTSVSITSLISTEDAHLDLNLLKYYKVCAFFFTYF